MGVVAEPEHCLAPPQWCIGGPLHGTKRRVENQLTYFDYIEAGDTPGLSFDWRERHPKPIVTYRAHRVIGCTNGEDSGAGWQSFSLEREGLDVVFATDDIDPGSIPQIVRDLENPPPQHHTEPQPRKSISEVIDELTRHHDEELATLPPAVCNLDLLVPLMVQEMGYTKEEAERLKKKHPDVIVAGMMAGKAPNMRAIAMALEMAESKESEVDAVHS